jgi:SH3-like domain-containing protein
LDDLGIGGPDIVRVDVPEGSSVNLREEPSLDASVVMRVKTSLEAERIGEEEEWTNIIISDPTSLDSTTEGWIHSDFIEEGSQDIFDEDYYGEYEQESKDIFGDSTVVIDETPTGWLRVREVPNGAEIAKVYPGDVYPMIKESAGWYQIEFGDGSSGWISGTYASVQ